MATAGNLNADVVQPLVVTASELATMLRVSSRTVWRMLSAGQLPQPIRVGGIVRWRLEEVNQWIEAGCPEQP